MKPHLVRRLKSTRIPKSACFFYCIPTISRLSGTLEHHSLKRVAAEWWQRSGRTWSLSDSVDTDNGDSLNAWIISHASKHPDSWLYTHRLGYALTLLGFWDRMADGEWTIKDTRPPKPSRTRPGQMAKPSHGICITADPPTLLSVWHRSRFKVRMVDIRNYADCGVPDLAKLAGIGKGEPAEAIGEADKERAELTRGVDAIRGVILGLKERWQREELGTWKATLGGLSWSAYRSTIADPWIFIDPEPLARKLTREAYYGGESRLWRIGRFAGPVYEVDLASAYCWAMSEFTHPFRTMSTRRNIPVANLRRATQHLWVAAVVRVVTEDIAYPIRRDGRVRYCVGDFYTVLCGEELRRAVQRGDVTECILAITYGHNWLFRGFGRQWWQWRLESERGDDQLWRHFAKAIPNALYGRFGMQIAEWTYQPKVASPVAYGPFTIADSESGECERYRAIGWQSLKEGAKEDGPDTLPAIAASITAAVRVRMRDIAAVAGNQNCYWQATDCILMNEQGAINLRDCGYMKDDTLGYPRCKGLYGWVRLDGFHCVETSADLRIVGLKAGAIRTGERQWRQRTGPTLESMLFSGGPVEYVTAESTFRPEIFQPADRCGEDGSVRPPRVIDDGLPVCLQWSVRPEEMPQENTDEENANRVP